MISRGEIIDRANCAYASGNIGIGNLWMSLLGSLDLVECARQRPAASQEELQKDKDDERNGYWTR